MGSKPLKSKPRFELTEPAIWTLGFGIVCLGGSGLLESGSLIQQVAVAGGILYLAVGIGVWQEKRLAVAAGMWLFLMAAILRAGSLAFVEFKLGRVGMFLIFGWLAWRYWKSLQAMDSYEIFNTMMERAPSVGTDDDSAPDKPLISIVLLLQSSRYMDSDFVASEVQSAWGGRFASGDEVDDDTDDDAHFVVGESPLFVIKSEHGMFVVHNHNSPYFGDVDEVTESIGELRLREAVASHQAWLSVDLMNAFDQSMPPEEFYPLIIRLIYEFADDNVLAVMRPETGQINLWNDDVLEALLRPDGTESFSRVSAQPAVIPVAQDDPLMIAAVEEARSRWPEFVNAFAQRTELERYSVKAPVTVGETTEFIWISVTGLEPEYIHGTLGNEPVALEGLTLGSQVEVPVADLNDWCILKTREEDPIGLFTVKAVAEAQRRMTQDQ